MPALYLRDHADQRQWHVLQAETGAHLREIRPDGDRRLSGFGCHMRLGLLRIEPVFASLYTVDGESLFLRVGKSLVELTTAGSVVRRPCLAPFVRRFWASDSGVVAISTTYWTILQSGHASWPVYDDFFGYVQESAGSLRSALTLAYSWKALADGRDLKSKEFNLELSAHQRSHGAI